jgi:exosortase/archaeosortase family protein
MMVDEACSGINSFFAALCLTLFFCLFSKRHWLHLIMLMAFVPVWTLIFNTMRVVAVVVLRSRFDIPADEGLLHEAIGAVVFIITMVALLSTDRLIGFFLPFTANETDHYYRRSQQQKSPHTWNVRSWASTPIPAALFILPLLLYFASGLKGEAIGVTAKNKIAWSELGQDFLPPRIGEWRRLAFRTQNNRELLGTHDVSSQIWALETNGVASSASLDYTFADWHDLTVCYSSVGWQLIERKVITDGKDAEGRTIPTYMYAEFKKPTDGKHGMLFFSAFSDKGKLITPPSETNVIDQFKVRIKHFGQSRGFAPPAASYQTQLFAELQAPPSEVERKSAENLYGEFVARIVAKAADVSGVAK